MKTHKIHSGSGESLAEVMVSAVIFFIMMAVLQGAISFSTNAQHKSEEIREKMHRFAGTCRLLPTFPEQKAGTTYSKPQRQTEKHRDQKRQCCFA